MNTVSHEEISSILKSKFDVIHKRPLSIKDRRTGEYRQIGELSYITARQVMERLDEAFGPFGWTAKFSIINSNANACDMLCTITVKLPDGTVIERQDFGHGESKTDIDSGIKAAASDALKRAAVQFGIGRYLYDEERDDRDSFVGGHQPQQRQTARRDTGSSDSGSAEPYSRQRYIYNRLKRRFSEMGITPNDFLEVFDTEFSEEGIGQLLEHGHSFESIIDAIVNA